MSNPILGRLDNILKYLDDIKIDDIPDLVSASDVAVGAKLAKPAVDSRHWRPAHGSKPAQIMDALEKMGIYAITERAHDEVETSEKHLEVTTGMPGVVVKNILLKTKRGKVIYLVVFPATKPDMNLKSLGKHLGVGSGLRFADSEMILDMHRGCVTPLAVLFAQSHHVEVILDAELENAECINVHPGTNGATVGIGPKDLFKFLETHGKGGSFLDLNQFIGQSDASGGKGGKSQKSKPDQKTKQGKKPHKKLEESKQAEVHGSEQEGITFDKYTQFGDWYKEIVSKCELIDYTDISGCYVLRPQSYFIWEQIKNYMDGEIKTMGVSNAYFPMFVSEDALKREAKHFEDFNPEVAWVTHSGDRELDKKLAVRPTSETIMYPMYRRWIRSFRDLPLKLNQWCNVVRWEFKNPTPFLRTREFLWQEGHTAHATYEEAEKTVREALDMYARTYSHMCAIATIQGRKTKNETFPGADYSTTVEAYIPGSGRGIQGGTSHCLGRNFSKMFDINFLDEKNDVQQVVQTSWGFTTRSVGVAVMNHSDNKGLVLPPRLAQRQVVIIPIHFKAKAEVHISMEEKAKELCHRLNKAGIRAFVDDRDTKNPGWKFNEWELKGIPMRLELGPKDMQNEMVMAARRDKRDEKGRLLKSKMQWKNLETEVASLLGDIHDNLYQNSEKTLSDNIVEVTEWNAFLKAMNCGKLVMAPHCDEAEWEEKIGELSKQYFEDNPDTTGAGMTGKAKALCVPLKQPELKADTKCIVSGKPAKCWILFGRSY